MMPSIFFSPLLHDFPLAAVYIADCRCLKCLTFNKHAEFVQAAKGLRTACLLSSSVDAIHHHIRPDLHFFYSFPWTLLHLFYIFYFSVCEMTYPLARTHAVEPTTGTFTETWFQLHLLIVLLFQYKDDISPISAKAAPKLLLAWKQDFLQHWPVLNSPLKEFIWAAPQPARSPKPTMAVGLRYFLYSQKSFVHTRRKT